MSVIQLLRPTQEHVDHIANTMRESDAVEVRLAAGQTPREALEEGVRISDRIATLVINDTPCAIFGLVFRDLLCGQGVPWLLSSESIMSHKRQFLLQSKPVIDEMLGFCSELINYVHVENNFSISWLQRIGFTLGEPEPYGISGQLFHKFTMRRANV